MTVYGESAKDVKRRHHKPKRETEQTQHKFLTEAKSTEEVASWERRINKLCLDHQLPTAPTTCPADVPVHEEAEWWQQQIAELSKPTQQRVKGGQSVEVMFEGEHKFVVAVEHKPPGGAAPQEENDFWLQKVAHLAVPVEMLLERAVNVSGARELDNGHDRAKELELRQQKRVSTGLQSAVS